MNAENADTPQLSIQNTVQLPEVNIAVEPINRKSVPICAETLDR